MQLLKNNNKPYNQFFAHGPSVFALIGIRKSQSPTYIHTHVLLLGTRPGKRGNVCICLVVIGCSSLHDYIENSICLAVVIYQRCRERRQIT
jgi:hypothetical protein